MAVYRFRVTFEDNEEIFRDIDIKSTQNFHDFHSIILSSIGFEDSCDASFFISDDVWRKGDEIALHPLKEDPKEALKKKIKAPKYIMKNCKMAALIDDPHQKFIYVHDPNLTWTFMVELLKILPDNPKINYPVCSKSEGVAPKKVPSIVVIPDILDDELGDIDDLPDNDAYAHATTEEFDLDEADDVETEAEGEEESEEEQEADIDGEHMDDPFVDEE